MPVLALVLMAMFLAVCCFFVEGHAYFNPTNRVSMTDLEFFLSLLVISIVIFLFYYYVLKRYNIRLNWPFLVAAITLFVVDIVAAFFFSGVYDTGQLVYMPSFMERIRSVLSFGITCLSLYTFFVVFPQIDTDRIFLILAAYGLVIIAVSALLYSYFTEFDIYKNLFLNGGPENYYTSPQSFTTQRNIYARILLYGIFAEAYLQMVSPHRWRWFLQLFFYINGFLILSKATTFVATLFMLCYSIWLFFRTFRKQKRYNLISFGVTVFLIILLLTGEFSGYFSENAHPIYLFFASFREVILDSISSSFLSRYYDWSDLLREITKNPLTIFFGFGENLMQNVLNLVTGLTPSASVSVPLDNALLYIWSRSGLIGILIYAAEILYFFHLVFEGWSKGIAQSTISFFILICFLILGMVENCNALNFLSDSLPMLLLLAYPLLSEHLWAKNQECQNDALSAYLKPEVFAKPMTKKSALFVNVAFAVEAPFAAVLIGGQHTIDVLYGVSYFDNPIVLISIGLFFLLLPSLLGRMVELWCQKRKKSFVLLLVLSLLFSFGIWVVPVFNPLYSLVPSGVGIALFIYLGISGSLWFLPFTYREFGRFLLFLGLTSVPIYLFSVYSSEHSSYLFFLLCVYAILAWLAIYCFIPLFRGKSNFYFSWLNVENRVSNWAVKRQINHEIANQPAFISRRKSL